MGVQSTSREAYYGDVVPKLGEKQQRVYNTIKNAKRPVCDQELAIKLDQPINQITPRRKELVEMGRVRQAFKDVYPKTNRKVIYWETEDGRH